VDFEGTRGACRCTVRWTLYPQISVEDCPTSVNKFYPFPSRFGQIDKILGISFPKGESILVVIHENRHPLLFLTRGDQPSLDSPANLSLSLTGLEGLRRFQGKGAQAQSGSHKKLLTLKRIGLESSTRNDHVFNEPQAVNRSKTGESPGKTSPSLNSSLSI